MNATLTHGQRYAATLALGYFEQLASNETVADKLKIAGFVGVSVDGKGRNRVAVGIWTGPTREVELPSQVSNVKAIE